MFAIQLDEMISKIKDMRNDITHSVASLTPVLQPHGMVNKLKDFKSNEFGIKFELLDNLFNRELLNSTKITLSSDQFIVLIEYFNSSENYAKRQIQLFMRSHAHFSKIKLERFN